MKMIDSLIGKMNFDEPKKLTAYNKKTEINLEENNLDLFTYNSPIKNAGSIGRHLSSFSQKYLSLPCYLYLIDDWLSGYFTLLESEKSLKKVKRYGEDELRVYLAHKVIICKIVKNQVLSKNLIILESVNRIKAMVEGHSLVGKAKKYLGVELNPYQLSSSDFDGVREQINQLKEGVN
jgi:hypothetical protein